MMLMLLALLVILIVAGAGFAVHVLWWVAIAALIVWLIGFFVRRAIRLSRAVTVAATGLAVLIAVWSPALRRGGRRSR